MPDVCRYIWSQVPWYLYTSMVTAILEGVIQAVEEKKAEWKLGQFIIILYINEVRIDVGTKH